MRVTFERVSIDWNDDGQITHYGWRLMLYIGDKHRAAWHTTGGTSRMWPHISQGADENCNRAITFTCWPIGMLDVWWEPNWRADDAGPCDQCIAEFEEMTA